MWRLLKDGYLECIEQQTRGQLATLQWHAHRASGGLWQQQVRDVVATLWDDDILGSLGLDVLPGDDSPSLQLDFVACAASYLDIVNTSISVRSWSFLSFSTTLPYKLAVIRHEDPVVAQTGLRAVKKLWKALLKLEALIDADDTPKAVG